VCPFQFQIIIQKYESFCFLRNLAATNHPGNMLLIHVPSITNRFKYIASLVVRQMLGAEVEFTTSGEQFSSYTGPKMAYGNEPAGDGLFIESAGLLFEEEIIQHHDVYENMDGVNVLFATKNPLSGLHFDPFAAAFYMVSRYEEYQPHKKDKFGRFPATESVAWTGGFIDQPVVHHWAGQLGKLLSDRYPGIIFNPPKYRYIPTIDVDHAWCYRGRTLARTLGGFARSLINARLQEIPQRVKVLSHLAPDPYDNYDFINNLHSAFAEQPLYFILFADYGGNDNNVSIDTKDFKRLLRDLDMNGKVGIHPSFSSNNDLLKLENEIGGLCDVLGRDVTISRQHFLKLAMPKTYRTLLQFGITDDFSMGYASCPGFRAGMAMPFPFFDLLRNEATNLVIHPVSLMDVTMKDYLRLTPEESLDRIRKMILTVRAVNGEFVSLWHNESLGNTGRWMGWRAVYEEMVKLAAT
jgi:hypothetical protein